MAVAAPHKKCKYERVCEAAKYALYRRERDPNIAVSFITLLPRSYSHLYI